MIRVRGRRVRWLSSSPRLGATALFLVAHAACSQQNTPQPASTSYHPPEITKQTVARFNAPIYGASGVTQLPDGRVLVAEDEERHPFDIIDLFGSGAAHDYSEREIGRLLAEARIKALNDL